MTRCTKCVLPDTFPEISFDEEGVCSICTDSAKAKDAPLSDMTPELMALIEEAKARQGRYDAVVAYSGGKDSSYLLHLMKERFDLRLLAVTFDNGFSSGGNEENIRNVVTSLGVDHMNIRYRQDHLNALFTESALGPIYPDHLIKYGSGVCISCIRIVMTAMLRTAIEKDIPLVLLGNTPGQILNSKQELIFRDNLIPYQLRRQLFSRLAERTGSWAYDYVMLSAREYATRPFPHIVSPLPILGYDTDEIFRVIQGHGWRRPQDVDPNSTNCRLNAFGIVRHRNLYRFHPYDYEVSELVRQGSLTREAALTRLEDPDGSVMDLAAQVEKDLLCRQCSVHGGC